MEIVQMVAVIVAAIVVVGIVARLTMRSVKNPDRVRVTSWAILAVCVTVYVVADAMSDHHSWFGLGAMVFLLCVSTYDLAIWRRNNR